MNRYLIAIKNTRQNLKLIDANSRNKSIEDYDKIRGASLPEAVCLAEKVNGVMNVIDKDVTYVHMDWYNPL